MDEARNRTLGVVYDAEHFAALPAHEREGLRDSLMCTGCGADAYFIRQARNGRRACFGARPHGEDCELASLSTEDGGSASLDEVDERLNAGDVFRIDANRVRSIRHVRHDPGQEPSTTGSAVRYTGRGKGTARVSSMNLDRLLRQLVLREKFRRSKVLLIMPDDSRQTVRSGCVHMSELEDKHFNRLRIYWGVIRFPRPKDGGGAWLNTGSRGSPTVVIEQLQLEDLLERKGLTDLDDLSGSYFAMMDRVRRAGSGGRYLFANDLAWFALRPYGDDEAVN